MSGHSNDRRHAARHDGGGQDLLEPPLDPFVRRHMRLVPPSAAPQFDIDTDAEAAEPVTEVEMYRWIRDNRGNYAIDDALRNSDRNEDFDARIQAAIRRSRSGRHRTYLPGR